MPSRDSPRYLAVALAVLAVIAVTLVAAAVAPVFSQEQGGDRAPQIEEPPQNGSGSPSTGLPNIPFGPMYVAVLVLIAIGIAVQFSTDPWESLKVALGVAAFLGVIYVFVRAALNSDLTTTEENRTMGDSFATPRPEPTDTSGFVEGTGTEFSWPVDGIAALAVGAAILALVAVVAVRSDAVRSAFGLDDAGHDDAGLDRETIGRVAGAAADRVESASTAQAADNAIYRAWSEMVALLDAPDPKSGTPRQFERAAIERGMDPEDVGILTRTFEEVRYGGASLSEERRERATAALRRIERDYQERDSTGASDGDRRSKATDASRREGGEGVE